MQADTKVSEADIRTRARQDGITHLSTGVAVVCGGKVLVVRRVGHDFMAGNFELPGGGVDDGETIEAGAIRELREETGLVVTSVLGTFDGFDYSTDRKPRVRQINFIVEAGPGEVTLDPNEHDGFAWVDGRGLAELPMSDSMRWCVHTALQAAH